MNRKAFYPFLFSLVLVIGILLGFLIRGHAPQTLNLAGGGSDKISEILNYINYRYVDSVNIDQLYEEAVNGIFRHLDPHSAYIPASELKQVNESLEGRFEGIGIEFNILDDTIIVVSTLPGGPSEKLGILSGDKIIEIEDSVVAGIGITNQEVIRRLKGPKGTEVRIKVARFGIDTLIPFTITRDRVTVPSVVARYMATPDIGYIRISQFAGETPREFREALDTLKKMGMKKLILDLRDNGGGYLQAATEIADELLDDRKLIVYTKGRAYPRKNYTAGKPGLFEEGELVVLVNEGTASASEILAGAIHDWDRGTIMGRRTYGKGLVQDQITLQDNSAIRLTIARYYTPSGKCIQRPYSNGVEEYNQEYLERLYETYEAHDTAVADTVEWGIKPDIILPVDTAKVLKLISQLNVRGIIQQYAYRYYGMHTHAYGRYKSPADFDQRYSMPETVYEGFVSFNKYTRSPVSQKDLWKYEEAFRKVIKGFVARNIFYTNGYFYFFNQLDAEYRAALDYLENH